MKIGKFVLGYAAAAIIPGVIAWPGMTTALVELNDKLTTRQEASDEFDSNELIGDLATVGATTLVGKLISDVILGKAEPESSETYPGTRPLKGTSNCAADKCCIWQYIANDMAAAFRGSSSRCNGLARAAIRLGFHDAGAWSKFTGGTGADGSIILANELGRAENNGLQTIAALTNTWYLLYKPYGVGMADLIQMGATVATVVCPLGPRVRSFVGRKDSPKPAVNGLLPDVFASADSLIKLFEDKTIKAHGLTALVGAHTTSQQRFVDPSKAFAPQDSTPGVWDLTFYGQTFNVTPTPPRVFKFPSDIKLSVHPKITAEWQKFITDKNDWDKDYSREYVRLSLLGVNNINNLTECSKVLPPRINSFVAPDQAIIDKWLNGAYSLLGSVLEDATLLTDALLKALGITKRSVIWEG